MSSRGQIVLPAEVRRLDQVEAGQEFEIERLATTASSGAGPQRMRGSSKFPGAEGREHLDPRVKAAPVGATVGPCATRRT